MLVAMAAVLAVTLVVVAMILGLASLLPLRLRRPLPLPLLPPLNAPPRPTLSKQLKVSAMSILMLFTSASIPCRLRDLAMMNPTVTMLVVLVPVPVMYLALLLSMILMMLPCYPDFLTTLATMTSTLALFPRVKSPECILVWPLSNLTTLTLVVTPLRLSMIPLLSHPTTNKFLLIRVPLPMPLTLFRLSLVSLPSKFKLSWLIVKSPEVPSKASFD